MKSVKWGEFRLGDLFEIIGTKSLDSNAIDFTDTGINFVGRTFEHNGIQGKIEKRNFEPNEPFTITATVIGNYKYVKYQKEPYYCSQNINKLTPNKNVFTRWSESIAYFCITNIQKFVSLYDGQQGGYKLNDIKNFKISLPITVSGEIDFDFMELFIRELEKERISELNAYLLATGLKDYTLTSDEENALEAFNTSEWGEYTFRDIFNNIKQGRRLKKEDQKEGSIPFVMSGTTNTGVVGFISNPVASFPANSITVDIFGNTFYRNYDFGAGDDTGVYWNDKENYSKERMLFFTTSMGKSVQRKFDYGKKLRSSQSFEIKMDLPIKDKSPDYEMMETFIKAVEKLVIKDVVLYTDRKITATNKMLKNKKKYRIDENKYIQKIAETAEYKSSLR